MLDYNSNQLGLNVALSVTTGAEGVGAGLLLAQVLFQQAQGQLGAY